MWVWNQRVEAALAVDVVTCPWSGLPNIPLHFCGNWLRTCCNAASPGAPPSSHAHAHAHAHARTQTRLHSCIHVHTRTHPPVPYQLRRDAFSACHSLHACRSHVGTGGVFGLDVQQQGTWTCQDVNEAPPDHCSTSNKLNQLINDVACWQMGPLALGLNLGAAFAIINGQVHPSGPSENTSL